MSKFNLFLLYILYTFCSNLSAQTVSTVAGSFRTPGSQDGTTSNALFHNPHGIALDADGNLYIADRYNHVIRKISNIGIVSTLAGVAGLTGDSDGFANDATFFEPWGLCVAINGDILVADTRNNKIRRVATDGMVTTIAGSGAFGGSDGIGQSASFGNPTGIEQAADGTIYIADHRTHTIRKISPDRLVTTLAGSLQSAGDIDGQGTDARFHRPYGLTLDQEGNIIVADEWNHKIRKITPQGWVTTIAGTGEIGLANGYGVAATFNFPWDVTVDKDGTIYVGDGYNYVVRKINPNTWVSTYAGTPQQTGGDNGTATMATFEGPTALVIDTSNQYIYISDSYNDLIRVIYPPDEVSLVLNTYQTNDTLCQGETLALFLQAPEASQCQLSINDIAQTIINPTQLEWGAPETGLYQISASAILQNGDQVLSDTLFFTVIEVPEAMVYSADNFELLDGQTIELQATGAPSFYWSTGDTTALLLIDQPGSYTLTPANPYCIGEAISIEIAEIITEITPTQTDSVQVYLPTAFSPNNDGYNDVFRVRGLADEASLKMTIYDHWGNLVFQSNDLQQAWNGAINQEPALAGVYTYLLRYQDGNHVWHLQSGQLVLHR